MGNKVNCKKPSETSGNSENCYPIIYNTKITVRDVESTPNGIWERYTLNVDIRKDFIVDVLIDNEIVYLRPTRRYFSSEFEKIFNFGIMCKDYDENKVVKVVFPKDYYKIFLKKKKEKKMYQNFIY